ncbi:hypothetical protein JAAARDRAFT_198556 [Jaapia argillacea MUCL 33604]|uniref:Uncharacterized protein n=1 Tax=Jaapia argillacea MUCL 33604 TaxID=933084 RepID=A0A067PP92_9AGAM|nr:hypothetical protein JAAARDRAFT_198556 [Jaapia argillacea MUCL 33604]
MALPNPSPTPRHGCNFTPEELQRLLRVVQGLYHLEGAPNPSEVLPLLKKLSEAASEDVSSPQGDPQQLWRLSNPPNNTHAHSSSLVHRSAGVNPCYEPYAPYD